MAKVLSIEVGYSLTKICEIEYKVKNPKVFFSLTIQTPEDAIEDGIIIKPEALSEAIKEVLHKNGIKTKQVVFSVSSTKIASREALLPFVKDNKIESLVEASAGDYFPVDISGYKITYKKLGILENEGGNKQYKLIVLAAPKDMLESYYAMSEKAGLTIAAIDYSGNSLTEVMREAFVEGTNMVIKVDERSTVLTVFSEGEMVLQRTVPYGGDTAIEEVIEGEADKSKISYVAALDILRRKPCIRQSLNPEAEDPNDEDDEEIKQFRLNISGSLSMLTSGILRVIDYYNSRNSERPLAEIYLTGYAENFVGLSDFMSAEMGSKVSRLSDLEGIVNDKAMQNSGEYIACIGAAIAPLDFIPDEHNEKKKKKVQTLTKSGKSTGGTSSNDYTRIAVIVLIGCVLVGGILSAVALVRYNAEKKNHEYLVQREAELAPIEITYAEYTSAQALAADALQMYRVTGTNNEGLLSFINELQNKLPSSVNVLSFAATSADVTLNMNMDSKEAVAQTIQELRNFDSLESVSVTAINEQTDETGYSVVNFTAACTYAPIVYAEDVVQTEQEGQ